MKGLKCFLFVLCLALCLQFSVFAFSASAFEFSINGVAVHDSGGSPYCRVHYTEGIDRWSNYEFSGSHTFLALGANTGNDARSIDDIECRHITDDFRIYRNEYVEMIVRVELTSYHPSTQYYWETEYSEGTFSGPRYISDGAFRGVYAEQVAVEENVGQRYEYWRLISRYVNDDSVNYIAEPFEFYNPSSVSAMYVRPLSWTIWQEANSLSADDRAFIQSIIAQHSDSAILQEIADYQEDTITAINSLRSTQEQANDDAQDRWEADKEEQAEREEDASDDGDALKSTFRFEIRNPFMGLLGLFTNNCPVNIPTIAGMIHSEETVYQCWFSQSVRSVLTPVFGIAASVLLFGFIVRGFLNKGNFAGGIEV